jgi:poly-gamma-glutamate capsule biosynthesis protein CapA/YwtB (metallophosphatase superfamily)
MEKAVKKLTPGAVLKKYNITAEELDQLLDQIYTELENEEGGKTKGGKIEGDNEPVESTEQ